MPEQYAESQLLNKAELAYLEDTLQAEYDRLEKQAGELNSELRKIAETLRKIKKLRNGSGGVLSSIDSSDLKRTLEVILSTGPLATRQIITQYFSLTGKEIERDKVFECLKQNQGKIFEVIGERAKAKWKLRKENGGK
jgi:hypothetical protein